MATGGAQSSEHKTRRKKRTMEILAVAVSHNGLFNVIFRPCPGRGVIWVKMGMFYKTK